MTVSGPNESNGISFDKTKIKQPPAADMMVKNKYPKNVEFTASEQDTVPHINQDQLTVKIDMKKFDKPMADSININTRDETLKSIFSRISDAETANFSNRLLEMAQDSQLDSAEKAELENKYGLSEKEIQFIEKEIETIKKLIPQGKRPNQGI